MMPLKLRGNRSPLISASLLAADSARLGEEVSAVLAGGADRIHCDVMDNHYVPNLSFGAMVCRSLRAYGILAPLEVHLMVEPVDHLIIQFAQAGATQIIFHPEATQHLDRSIELVRTHGCQAGLALNPTTSFTCLEYLWQKLDLILLMSVNPGFGGQSFIDYLFDKIGTLRKLIDEHNPNLVLEVDGGINLVNAGRLINLGVDSLVVGSALFGQGAKHYAEIIHQLKTARELS